jgi:hypothetical protein
LSVYPFDLFSLNDRFFVFLNSRLWENDNARPPVILAQAGIQLSSLKATAMTSKDSKKISML